MTIQPPDFRQVTPLFHTWRRADPISCVFSHAFPSDAMNPGTSGGIRGRFHFFADRAGHVVPVMYGSDIDDGAISETVFHDVPIRGSMRVVRESRLNSLSLVTLLPQRDLLLVQLFGHGLRRLQIRAHELTSTTLHEYPRTVRWAQASHTAFPDIDGLTWMSNQLNHAKAIVLFGDRIRTGDLGIAAPPLPLRIGQGRAIVDHAANQAGVTII